MPYFRISVSGVQNFNLLAKVEGGRSIATLQCSISTACELQKANNLTWQLLISFWLKQSCDLQQPI